MAMNIPHDELRLRLVDKLCALDCVREPQQRSLFGQSVSDRIGQPVDLLGVSARIDMVQLVKIALNRETGLEDVLYVVELLAGPDMADDVRAHVCLVKADEPRAAFEDSDMDEVRSLLAAETGIDPRAVRDRLALELRRELPYHLSVAGLFDHLLDANAQADGLPPAVVLVEYVAALVPRSGGRLRTWADRRATEIGGAEALLRRREALARPPEEDRDAPRCLVVMVDPAEDGSSDIVVRHWTNPAAGRWSPLPGEEETASLETLAAAVERAIRGGERIWAESLDQDGPLFVEFVLPYALLNHDVARLELGSGTPAAMPIGPRYLVHLRSLERMRSRDAGQLRRWRTRWKVLRSATVAQTHHWQHADDTYLRNWHGILMENEQLTAVILNTPAVKGRSLEALKAAIAEGIGLAVWDRREATEPQAREFMKMLVGFPPAQIPMKVRQVRATAESDVEGHRQLGRHLAFFWDDPHRLVDSEELSA